MCGGSLAGGATLCECRIHPGATRNGGPQVASGHSSSRCDRSFYM